MSITQRFTSAAIMMADNLDISFRPSTALSLTVTMSRKEEVLAAFEVPVLQRRKLGYFREEDGWFVAGNCSEQQIVRADVQRPAKFHDVRRAQCLDAVFRRGYGLCCHIGQICYFLLRQAELFSAS